MVTKFRFFKFALYILSLRFFTKKWEALDHLGSRNVMETLRWNIV